MGIVRKEEFISNDGIARVREFYDNGTIVERVSGSEPTAPEPTEQDFLQAEILLNQVSILENQRAQDAVMAEILLGQLEV